MYYYYCRQVLPAIPVVCQCAGVSSRQSCATSNGSTTYSILNQQNVEEQSKASSHRHTTMPTLIFRHKAKRYASDSATKRLPSFAKAKEAKNQKSPITKPSGHWTSMINRAAIVYQDWYSGCTCQSSVRRAFSPPRRPKIQDPRRKKTQVKTSFALLQTLSNANRNLDVWAATLPARSSMQTMRLASRQPYLTEPGQVTLPFA